MNILNRSEGILDKLNILTNDWIDKKELESSAIKQPIYYSGPKSPYMNYCSYDRGPKGTITWHFGPRYKKSGQRHSKLETNPGSNFDSWQDYENDLDTFYNNKLDYEICRLDCSIDIPHDLLRWQDILRYAFMGGVKTFKIFDTNRDGTEKPNGFHFGKGKKRFSVYEYEDKTRLEIQLSHEHCPIRKLNQIRKLETFSPFSTIGLEFYDFDWTCFQDIDNTISDIKNIKDKQTTLPQFQNSDLGRTNALCSLWLRSGYFQLSRFLDKGKNFHRYQQYFKKHPILSTTLLDEIFQRSMKNFFETHQKLSQNITITQGPQKTPQSLTMLKGGQNETYY
jgi:IS1 family transposase